MSRWIGNSAEAALSGFCEPLANEDMLRGGKEKVVGRYAGETARRAACAACRSRTSTNICGSDQHRVRGRTTAEVGLVLGHEITGEVIEVGRDVETLQVGDPVSLDDAPEGYRQFDGGAPKKFVIDPHGLLKAA
ncbi:hypothetical protein OKW30_006468 [Paraburkholderia sp. Clong3]